MELGNMLFGTSRGEFSVNRERFEAAFQPLFNIFEEKFPKMHHNLSIYPFYDNHIFIVRPYDWGAECDCGYDELEEAWVKEHPSEEDELWIEWCKENDHKPDCRLLRPNFYYYPTGFSLMWYKWPFRDSYCNQKLTNKKLAEMVNNCVESMKKGDSLYEQT